MRLRSLERMPTSDTEINEPKRPVETSQESGSPAPEEEPRPLPPPPPPALGGSRWVDYDTHELLTMISETGGRAALGASARRHLDRYSVAFGAALGGHMDSKVHF